MMETMDVHDSAHVVPPDQPVWPVSESNVNQNRCCMSCHITTMYHTHSKVLDYALKIK